MIKKLFTFKKENGEDLSHQSKEWMAKVIGGAVVADGIIHPNERPHLEHLYEALQEEPTALVTIRKIVQAGEPPDIDDFTPENEEVAEFLFKTVLEICACDFELTPGELKYINAAGMALGFDIMKTHRLINITLRRVKIDFFNHLLGRLHDEERTWLALVILKSIYADGRIDAKEIPYLNDVYELLEGNASALEKVKQDAKRLELNQLPKIYFEKDLARQILRYLVEIVLGDADVDHREMKIVRDIAHILQFEDHEVEVIADRVEQVRFFMRVSNEANEDI